PRGPPPTSVRSTPSCAVLPPEPPSPALLPMTCLFHHDIAVVVLCSGSRGNCTYVGDGRQGLLIDCGLSMRQVRLRLAAAGLPDAPIDAALVTHEHSDYAAAARSVARATLKQTGRHLP